MVEINITSLLISMVTRNTIFESLLDINTVKRSCSDYYKAHGYEVFAILAEGHKIEISFLLDTSPHLQYVSIEKMSADVESLLLDHDINYVKAKVYELSGFEITQEKRGIYQLRDLRFYFNENVLESIFFTPN